MTQPFVLAVTRADVATTGRHARGQSAPARPRAQRGSRLLVVLGLIAYSRLTLRELPKIDPPVVSVSVTYPGASAAVVDFKRIRTISPM